MGITWSTRHDFYVHQFQNPRVQTFSKELIIDVHKCNETNPFEHIVSKECADQQAVLVSLSLKTLMNGYDKDVQVFISNLYPGQPKPLSIVCPANFQSSVNKVDSTVFTHQLKLDKIEMYAGLDRVILKDVNNSESTTDFECFPVDHPVVEFIKNHGTLLEPGDGDIVKKEGETKTYYLVKKPFMTKVRAFFEEHVFSKMHYTRFEESKLFCSLDADSNEPKETLVFLLEVEYVLINPGNGKLFHTEERLK